MWSLPYHVSLLYYVTLPYHVTLSYHVTLPYHVKRKNVVYGICHQVWDRKVGASIVDLDQTPQISASGQSLHYLPLIQRFLDSSTKSIQTDMFKIYEEYGNA